jgi:uncharacterized protein
MKTLRMQSMTALAAIMLLIGVGCGDKGNDPLEYDRAALVANLGDNIIVPAYSNLQLAMTAVSASHASYRAQPSVTALTILRNDFTAAWGAWKQCSPYEFGPAASVSLRSAVNTFPTDTIQIKSNVNAGTWDLNLAANIDARGFPAMDFMLFGLGNDEVAVVARYTQPADSAHLHAYLGALIADVQALVAGVRNQWTSGYLATFKASLGTDVGSSTSLLVNELNRDLEIIKTASIGIPLGKQTFDQPLPEKVEGLYAGISARLASQELVALYEIYLGEGLQATDAYGLEDALEALKAEYNGSQLSTTIRSQFSATRNALLTTPDPLSNAVVSNRVPVEAAYTEIQKLVILLKTDMASAMSILITYTDADGD